MKTRLILYLKKLGFTVDILPDKIYCKDGNNIILLKRGRINERILMSIKMQLDFQSYDIKEFDSTIIKHNNKIQENVKMFLFARWIATCFADSHIDSQGRTEQDIGFSPEDSMSVLNREKGEWYKDQIKYFNEVVYPNYLNNGSVKDAEKFFKA